MGGPGDAAIQTTALAKLGFSAGQVVQELGWDVDVDERVRSAIEAVTGTPLEDESYADGADAVVIWFRDGDDDLVDTIVDGLTDLVDRGFLVLCTPRTAQSGSVEPSDIEDAALTAGLHTAGGANISGDWWLTRMVAPKSHRR